MLVFVVIVGVDEENVLDSIVLFVLGLLLIKGVFVVGYGVEFIGAEIAKGEGLLFIVVVVGGGNANGEVVKLVGVEGAIAEGGGRANGFPDVMGVLTGLFDTGGGAKGLKGVTLLVVGGVANGLNAEDISECCWVWG